jgi:hypothetical protein
MRSIIGFTLLLVWGFLFILGIGEPTVDNTPNNPEWVGWVYIILLLGLPFVALNIIDPKKQ